MLRFLLGETGEDRIKNEYVEGRLRSLETKLESQGEDGLNMYKDGIANILVREIWSCWPRRKEGNSGSGLTEEDARDRVRWQQMLW